MLKMSKEKEENEKKSDKKVEKSGGSDEGGGSDVSDVAGEDTDRSTTPTAAPTHTSTSTSTEKTPLLATSSTPTETVTSADASADANAKADGSAANGSGGSSGTAEDCPLHKCSFEGNYKLLARLLQRPPAALQPLAVELARRDKHGNTPLHLAIMLGRKECVHLLLAHDAPVKVKNGDGWSPLAEAISYGDRQTIAALLRKLKLQSRAHMEARRANLVRALQQMQDFYMELKWDFASWVPLVSRILPSDICRIHKSGSSLRLDTTLVDFNDMRWERGNISFIFRGDRASAESLIVLDNEFECYQHVRYEDADLEDEVDVLMSTDILAAQMSTKSIRFARAQSGWIFREDRKELVGGQYQCDLYSIQGLVLKQRKRREHLSHDDLQKNRAIVDTITRGGGGGGSGRRSSLTNNTANHANAATESVESLSRRASLQPPPSPNLTWAQYLAADAGKCPQLGRVPIHKQSNKSLRATVAMSKDFPLSVDMLLNVLEVIAPFKHIQKLRDFVQLKLPTGFPVKVEIPVLHTVTAKITFQKFEFRDNISPELFEVPDHYVEDARRFPDL